VPEGPDSAWISVADIPADTKSSTASTAHRMCRTQGLPWQMSLCEQDQADVVFEGGNAGRDPLLFSRFPRRYLHATSPHLARLRSRPGRRAALRRPLRITVRITVTLYHLNYGDTLPFTLFSVRATLSAWLGSQESSSPAFRTT